MKVLSISALFLPLLLAVEGDVDSNLPIKHEIDASSPNPSEINNQEIYGHIEDVLQAKSFTSKECKKAGARCNRWNTCCDGSRCVVTRCAVAGKTGDTCQNSMQCSKGLKCRKLRGKNKACIPDVAKCLLEARKESREKVFNNMEQRFVAAVKDVAPKKRIIGWKQWKNLKIKNVAKAMCSAMEGYQSATKKAMDAFEKCTKDYPENVQDMIKQSAILRFGVEGDATLNGLTGSAGAGIVYNPVSKQYGCYGQVCAGAMVAVGGGNGAAPVVGMEFVENMDDLPLISYEGSLQVPFGKKYVNAYNFSPQPPYITGAEIKDKTGKGKLGGSAYICHNVYIKYEKKNDDDDSGGKGDDDSGDKDEGDDGNSEGDDYSDDKDEGDDGNSKEDDYSDDYSYFDDDAYTDDSEEEIVETI